MVRIVRRVTIFIYTYIYIHIYIYIYIKVGSHECQEKQRGKFGRACHISLPHFSLRFSCMFAKDMPLLHMLLGVLQKIRAESITLQLVYLLGNKNPSCSSSSEIQFVQAVLYPSGTGSSQVNKSFQTFCNWSLAHTENGVNIPRG